MSQVNDYSWCGTSSFTVSNWAQKVADYTDYSLPIFLSEFGCNQPSPRQFGEVSTLYSEKMSSVFSGGLVYEYTEEPNNYGLVKISDDGKTVTPLGDFEVLKKEYAAAKNPLGNGGARIDIPISSCPPTKAGLWEASSNLPVTPSKAETYFVSII